MICNNENLNKTFLNKIFTLYQPHFTHIIVMKFHEISRHYLSKYIKIFVDEIRE